MSSCSTTVAPWFRPENAVHCAAACMSGATGYHGPPAPVPVVTASVIDSAVAPSTPARAET